MSASKRVKSPAVQPPSVRKPSLAPVLVRAGALVLAGLLTYANALSGPFFLDDLETITTNEQIRHLSPPSALLLPARELPVAGRPVVNVSFALNYAAGGLDVFGYHLVNVALHIACALVLFGVLRRTLQLPSLSSRFGQGAGNLAFAAALIWLVHPLQTEAVDYVTERTELMMGLFYLLTMYASIRALDRQRWQGVAVVCCLLGMGCKESMATAPVMVMLYDRIFIWDSFKSAWRRRWPLYVGLAATWILLAALLSASPRPLSAGFSTGVSPWTYLLNQSRLILQYLRLAFWPTGLVVMYGNPLPLTFAQVLPEMVAVAALVGATLAALVARPPLGFLGAWLFITLAPTSSIVPIATEVGAERRMYLPLAALVVLVVIGASRVLEHRPRLLRPALLALVAIALASGTVVRNREYSSAVTLARTVMARWPTARAQHWLGAELVAAGRHDEGLAALRAALPGDPRVHYTLGMALYTDGSLDDAIQHLRAFVAAEPLRIEVPAARETIGRALTRQGKLVEAAAEFRAVILMTPGNADVHGLLADALLGQQKFDEAIPEYRLFLQRRPGSVDGLMNLGIALVSTGKSEEAIAAFGRAVEADPRHAGAQRDLARALIDAERYRDALPHAEAAVNLAPADPVAHDELGQALAGDRRFTDAVLEFERSLQLDPTDADVRAHLAAATRAKGAIIAHP